MESVMNPIFEPNPNMFSCANHILFTINQTHEQYQQKTPTILLFDNLINQADIQISTYYDFISPTLNTSVCEGDPTGSTCSIAINNNCKDITYFRFFDTIQLNINFTSENQVQEQYTFVYNLICDKDIVRNAFEVGLIVLIIYAGIVIWITSKYSVARSWKNREYQIGYISIIGFTFFSTTAVFLIFSSIKDTTLILSYFLIACSILYGVFSIMVCFTQLLYKRNKYLNLELRIGSKIKIRIMDILGFLLGAGVEVGWWFSKENWILSDFIFTCMLIVTIKFFRFKSLKTATLAFVLVTIVFVVFIALSDIKSKNSFNSLMLSLFNNPFFLVCPTITPVPNQPCSWISIISLAYPGLVLSYL